MARGLAFVLIAAAVLGRLLMAAVAPASAETRPPATVPFPVATAARLAGDQGQTRFVVDLSQKVEMRAFTLPDPYRVIVDLPQVTFDLPAKSGERGRGLIKAYRYGLVMPGGSRIVIDTTGPVRVERAFVLDPVNGLPARLVLDLASVDRATFLRAAAIDNRLPRDPPPVQGDHDPAAAGDPRPIVVLDPGHGGIDSGTVAPSGEEEKNLVLAFGLALRDRLEQTGRYRVVMTRSDDRFIPLNDRVRFARDRNAQLFISIHCDALRRRDGEAAGATVYTLSEKASDTEAERLADTENKADVISGVDLSAEPDEIAGILIDLAQRETKNYTTRFARGLVDELGKAARLHKKPLKSAGFRVLTAPDVPSVLIELGYVSNKTDMKMLTSDAWRTKAADSITQAVDAFFHPTAPATRAAAEAH
ncbi:N-acetylmuramoyl-L-alanine amidase [Rhodovulum sp. PH10]|uniref:N-acetylmuramoyl-L-alanine amidase n=1 Tax=Rhodovulum sp. PH10 TaxID=1187851 RepID=UPI00027C28A4|nr:N-acetylmuramoyl-L-alanine amidase [Rhodovulum sp. PH10]EJW12965.1 N-acetylmuramoyl-L-alanine amidase [Rhodovulum sp. PH10]